MAEPMYRSAVGTAQGISFPFVFFSFASFLESLLRAHDEFFMIPNHMAQNV